MADAQSGRAESTGGTLDDLMVRPGSEEYVARVLDHLDVEDWDSSGIAVSDRFREVVDLYDRDTSGTPAGFRVEKTRSPGGIVLFDLVRDIGRGPNGGLRPTPLLFSVDSANPYEVAPCAGIVANLTCNPGIVYDLFLNDPSANRDRTFGTVDEVLAALSEVLGPGCDISVELEDPFEEDFSRVIEEVERYEAIVGCHRLVVKVPHTGPVTRSNALMLSRDGGRLPVRYNEGGTADYLSGHNLALRLQEQGYRVNFTLMFEPHQVPLALQVRPYFINAFIRHRHAASRRFLALIAAYEASGEVKYVEQLREDMVLLDYLSAEDADLDLLHVLEQARAHLSLRGQLDGDGDGLDGARDSLRWLKTSNLPDTRLIICSMEDMAFPQLTKMLIESEFESLHDRVVITTDPNYLASWTSSPHVISYQRRFLAAVAGGVQ